MRTADLLAAAIAVGGASTVFGVVGEGTLAIVDSLVHRHGVRYVATAREDGAVLMADGFARAGGNVGFAAITHGPALTNAVTALTEAARARTPLVVVVGDTPVEERTNPQDIDQCAVVAPTGAAFVQVRAPGLAAEDVAIALRLARVGARPVVLNVPRGFLEEDAGEGHTCAPPPAPVRQRVAPVPEVVESALAILRDAKRTVVVAGRGAVESGARAQLERLAGLAHGHLATTLWAKGLFAGSALDIGICGGFASPAGHERIRVADCVVSFGAGLNRFTTDNDSLLGTGCRIIQVDVDPSAFGLWRDPDVAVLGDAGAVADALSDGLEAHPPPTEPAAIGADRGPASAVPTGPPGSGMAATDLVRLLNDVFPANRTVVADGGHASTSEPARWMDVPDPAGFVYPVHFGSIGLGFAEAIGAALGRPDRPVLSFVGDGGFMMGLAELGTAVAHRARMAIVVMNDAAYGWEYHQMKDRGMDLGLSLLQPPDFVALARAFGADAVSVTTLDEVAMLESRLQRLEGPLLIDAHLDRDARTEWYAERFAPTPGP